MNIYMSMPKENFGLRILSKMLTYTETQVIYVVYPNMALYFH